MMIMFTCGILALVTVLIVCELGQRMSDAFDGIDFTTEQFDWYSFPINIKRMLPTIMAIVQQPAELECFGSITATREVFRKVSIKQQSIEQMPFNEFKLKIRFPSDSSLRFFVFHGVASN